MDDTPNKSEGKNKKHGQTLNPASDPSLSNPEDQAENNWEAENTTTTEETETESKVIITPEQARRREVLSAPDEIQVLAGPISTADILESPSPPHAQEILHNNTEQAPSAEQSSLVLFPLPANSEDIRNDNHLALARILDNSVWDMPVNSQELSNHEQHVERGDRYCLFNSTDSEDEEQQLLQQAFTHLGMESDHSEPPGGDNDNNEPPPLVELDLPEQELTTRTTALGAPDSNELPSTPGHQGLHVIAEWPSTNLDFEILSKLDDGFSSSTSGSGQTTSDSFRHVSHQVSGIFDIDDWVLPLSDDDVPPAMRLRPNPGHEEFWSWPPDPDQYPECPDQEPEH